jgi:hypothetical protein
MTDCREFVWDAVRFGLGCSLIAFLTGVGLALFATGLLPKAARNAFYEGDDDR